VRPFPLLHRLAARGRIINLAKFPGISQAC